MYSGDNDDDLTHSEQLRLYEEAFSTLIDESSQRREKGAWEGRMKIYSLAFREEHSNPVHGDSIIMAPDVLNELTKNEVEFPLLFKVTCGERSIYCKCLEFTAQKGLCYFPAWLMEDLGVNNGDTAFFTHTTLPKATYAKLKPHSADYLRWTNKKAVLEATLTNFATMSVGNTLVIDFNGQEYQFDVVDLKPENAVCILNSDVEVDFVEDTNNGFEISQDQTHVVETKNEEPEEPINNNNNNNNNININNNSNNNNNSKNQNPPRRRERGEREKDKNTSKPNLFTGQGFSLKDSPVTTSHTNGVANNSTSNNNINTNNVNTNRPISNNESNQSPLSSKIDNVPQNVNTETKEEENDDYFICKNCEKSIPKASARVHEPYCFRNNYKCPKCNVVLNKATKDQHEEEFHSEIPCELCDQPIERSKMQDHLVICPKQKTKCNYCELSFPLSDIEEHTHICSSRTEKCEICGKYILLRDIELHFTSNCTYPSSTESLPSWEKTDLRKSLIFCEDCFTPFYEFEEYQMHLALQLDQLNTILNSDDNRFDDIISVVSHKSLFDSLDEKGRFLLVTKLIDAFPDNDNAQALEKFTNFLQSHQIDLTTTSPTLQNFLHAVARAGKKDLIPLFRNAGLDVNSMDVDGNTPIHVAALSGSEQCLIDFGDCAEVNLPNSYGYTPLALAVDQMRENTIKCLISIGGHFGDDLIIGDHRCDAITPAIAESLVNMALGFTPYEISNILNLLQYFSEEQVEYLRHRFLSTFNEYDEAPEVRGSISVVSIRREGNKFAEFTVSNSGALEFTMIFEYPKDSRISVEENHHTLPKKTEVSIHARTGNSSPDKQIVVILHMKGAQEHSERSFFDFVLLRPID